MILVEDESKNKDIRSLSVVLEIYAKKKRGEPSSLLAAAVILDKFNHHISNRLLFILISD